MTHPRLIDISGHRFGEWTVHDKTGNNPRGGALWRCVCSCGAERQVLGSDLRNGKSVSCGCKGIERIAHLNKSHGETGTRIYRTWKNMRARCLNSNKPGYEHYGGRGISICAEWSSFPAFRKWALESGYADDLSIERKDVDGDYTPSNCVWADAATQSANRRFVSVAPDGDLWWHKAKSNSITVSAYRSRLNAGWPIEVAASWPMHSRRVPRQRNSSGKFV